MNKLRLVVVVAVVCLSAMVSIAGKEGTVERSDGKHLFERETFGGNGRTCATCHDAETGTVSPADAQARFRRNPTDPLFRHDGSDDGNGHGVARMLADATVLITVPLHENVRLADDPSATSVTLVRGIASTLNTPALDPVLMVDGRRTSLQDQAAGAIRDHAQAIVLPTARDLDRIAEFERTDAFFTSDALRRFAAGKGPAPSLPLGRTQSERRGRRFFEDIPPDPTSLDGLKNGLCSTCHSGPLLNSANEFIGLVVPGAQKGDRFQNVGVSDLNVAGNPMRTWVFTNPDGTTTTIDSPDPGRALITGIGPAADPTFENWNAFKISPLRGIRRTAPYFHDNSAKTLEDVMRHYTIFFNVVTNGAVALTPQDEADIVAFMKLL